jgi:hypothetical protein
MILRFYDFDQQTLCAVCAHLEIEVDAIIQFSSSARFDSQHSTCPDELVVLGQEQRCQLDYWLC